MRTAEKNRYQNSMTISRIRIDCVLTDPFGKSATNIMEYLLSHNSFNEKECEKLIDGRVKASHEAILDNIRGYEILAEQKFKITHVRKHLNFIESAISEIELELFHLSRPYDELIKLS